MKKIFLLSLVLGLFVCLNAENKNEKHNTSIKNGDCINGYFSHYEDGICIANLTLTSSCRFTFNNNEDYESLIGKYELSNEVSYSNSATIYLYSDSGEQIAYGTIYYGSDKKLTVLLGDFILKKRS